MSWKEGEWEAAATDIKVQHFVAEQPSIGSVAATTDEKDHNESAQHFEAISCKKSIVFCANLEINKYLL